MFLSLLTLVSTGDPVRAVTIFDQNCTTSKKHGCLNNDCMSWPVGIKDEEFTEDMPDMPYFKASQGGGDAPKVKNYDEDGHRLNIKSPTSYRLDTFCKGEEKRRLFRWWRRRRISPALVTPDRVLSASPLLVTSPVPSDSDGASTSVNAAGTSADTNANEAGTTDNTSGNEAGTSANTADGGSDGDVDTDDYDVEIPPPMAHVQRINVRPAEPDAEFSYMVRPKTARGHRRRDNSVTNAAVSSQTPCVYEFAGAEGKRLKAIDEWETVEHDDHSNEADDEIVDSDPAPPINDDSEEEALGFEDFGVSCPGTNTGSSVSLLVRKPSEDAVAMMERFAEMDFEDDEDESLNEAANDGDDAPWFNSFSLARGGRPPKTQKKPEKVDVVETNDNQAGDSKETAEGESSGECSSTSIEKKPYWTLEDVSSTSLHEPARLLQPSDTDVKAEMKNIESQMAALLKADEKTKSVTFTINGNIRVKGRTPGVIPRRLIPKPSPLIDKTRLMVKQKEAERRRKETLAKRVASAQRSSTPKPFEDPKTILYANTMAKISAAMKRRDDIIQQRVETAQKASKPKAKVEQPNVEKPAPNSDYEPEYHMIELRRLVKEKTGQDVIDYKSGDAWSDASPDAIKKQRLEAQAALIATLRDKEALDDSQLMMEDMEAEKQKRWQMLHMSSEGHIVENDSEDEVTSDEEDPIAAYLSGEAMKSDDAYARRWR